MNEMGFNTMRTIVDIGLLVEKAKREARDMDDEITELKTKLTESIEALWLAYNELDRITGDVGFEPERFRQRMKAVQAAGAFLAKHGGE